jgi:tRNA pseudouridine55 synthase
MDRFFLSFGAILLALSFAFQIPGATFKMNMELPLMDGVLVVDKPAGITSHDAVIKVRKILGIKRIGHLGTLDPLATGVLPLVVGRATRLAQFFREREKVYAGVMRLGFATDTYDRLGEPITPEVEPDATLEEVEAVFRELSGEHEQQPPPVSAKKVGGVAAYKLVRRNQPVELPLVRVRVQEFALESLELPQARFRVRCSGGTYVRSLIHDAGRRLGCGAHITELRRLASGEFSEREAITLERLRELHEAGRASEALVAAETLLPEFPPYKLPPAAVGDVLHGRDFRPFPPVAWPRIKVLAPNGQLLAIAERASAGFYHPSIVL